MTTAVPAKQCLLALTLATPLLIAGCGGGGGSSSAPADDSNPTAVAGDTIATPPGLDDMRDQITQPDDENDEVSTDSVCGGEQPFELIGTLPQPGTQDFALNGSLVFKFNAAVDPQSLDGSTFSFSDSHTFEFRVAGNQVVVDPQQDFDPNTDYLATMQGIFADCDLTQVILGDGAELPFTTGGEQALGPLQISTVYPTNGDELIDPRQPIVIEFSGALDPSSVSGGSLYLRQANDPDKVIGGSVSFDPSNRELSFLPSSPLDDQTSYEVVLEQALSGLMDNPLAEPLISLFRTGGDMAPIDPGAIDKVTGLGAELQGLADKLAAQFGGSEGSDGLNGYDNALLLTLPLAGPINGDALTLPDHTDTLIAICNPTAPGESCALALDIDVDPSGMDALMAAFQTRNPDEAMTAVVALLGQLGDPSQVSAPFSASLLLAEPGFTGLFPAPMNDHVKQAVAQIAAGLNQLPGIADWLGDASSTPLLETALFHNGSLLTIGGTDLLSSLALPELREGQTPGGALPALGDLATLLASGGDALPSQGDFLTGEVPGGLISGGSFDDLLNLISIDQAPMLTEVLGEAPMDAPELGDIPVLGGILETVVTALQGLF